MKRQRDNEGTESFDLTNCLMLMLSYPKQKRTINESVEFECKTCNRKFSSFQALGGHRASHNHKRVKLEEQAKTPSLWDNNKPRMHVCSVCGLGFSLGQALGGHMRKHRNNEGFSSSSSSSYSIKEEVAKFPVLKRLNSSKRVLCLDLDLNFPPMENDFMFGMKSPSPVPLSLF
ncbi:zinc finger protein ZAT11-like [Lotus japonicus]|uniref:zinc finger protein ZAT11-like n=1 Tax=Lotus japonicus TaxID=34305 RepID=UPI0025903071|nr:zinc finger protein ZAT11-like [Lotus japonicus]